MDFLTDEQLIGSRMQTTLVQAEQGQTDVFIDGCVAAG